MNLKEVRLCGCERLVSGKRYREVFQVVDCSKCNSKHIACEKCMMCCGSRSESYEDRFSMESLFRRMGTPKKKNVPHKLCKSSSVKCDVCGGSYCGECGFACEKCGKNTCYVCGKMWMRGPWCEGCEFEVVCMACTDAFILCEGCEGMYICDGCWRECTKCHLKYCMCCSFYVQEKTFLCSKCGGIYFN